MTVDSPRRTRTARAWAAGPAARHGRATAGGSGRSRGPDLPGGPPRDVPARRGRRRDPLWARLLVVFGAVLMMASGGVVVGSKLLIKQATSTLEQSNLLGTAGKTDAEGGKNLDGPIDLLLLGIDARAGWKPEDTRADTIIVLHIPASHDQAYLISIPRDTHVQVPPFAKAQYAGGTAKATEAFFLGAQNGGGREGGAQLMALTIKNLTGISFDGAAIIDFSGFKGVIDALGSVKMCVDQQVTSRHMVLVNGKPTYKSQNADFSGKQVEDVVYKKGCRNMKGWEALDFSRQRYGLANGDYDRQRHQQQLIKAMARKATQQGVVTNPLKLNELFKAAGKAFVLDTGGTPVADFVFTMRGISAEDLVLLRTNDGTFHGNSAGQETFNDSTLAMFAAAKNDTLGDFVVNNPTVLAPSA
jgi:LCP family protein required for cell wall assembly